MASASFRECRVVRGLLVVRASSFVVLKLKQRAGPNSVNAFFCAHR